jgi:hypothetical protein
MNSRSLLPFLGLNKLENEFLNLRTVSGPIQPGDTAHGAQRPAMHSGQIVAWVLTWQPGPEPARPGRPGCIARVRDAATVRSPRIGHMRWHGCNASPLPTPWCGLAGEDEESLGSTSEVAMRTGTHRRLVLTMRWFNGGEMAAFGCR